MQVIDVSPEVYNRSLLTVTATYSPGHLHIAYLCKRQGNSIVKYKILVSSLKGDVTVRYDFAILKRCGDIGLYSFRMGLKKFSMTK